jgi:hypothetical protein
MGKEAIEWDTREMGVGKGAWLFCLVDLSTYISRVSVEGFGGGTLNGQSSRGGGIHSLAKEGVTVTSEQGLG